MRQNFRLPSEEEIRRLVLPEHVSFPLYILLTMLEIERCFLMGTSGFCHMLLALYKKVLLEDIFSYLLPAALGS